MKTFKVVVDGQSYEANNEMTFYDIEEFTNSALFVASEVGQKFISPKFSNQIVKKHKNI